MKPVGLWKYVGVNMRDKYTNGKMYKVYKLGEQYLLLNDSANISSFLRAKEEIWEPIYPMTEGGKLL